VDAAEASAEADDDAPPSLLPYTVTTAKLAVAMWRNNKGQLLLFSFDAEEMERGACKKEAAAFWAEEQISFSPSNERETTFIDWIEVFSGGDFAEPDGYLFHGWLASSLGFRFASLFWLFVRRLVAWLLLLWLVFLFFAGEAD